MNIWQSIKICLMLSSGWFLDIDMEWKNRELLFIDNNGMHHITLLAPIKRRMIVEGWISLNCENFAIRSLTNIQWKKRGNMLMFHKKQSQTIKSPERGDWIRMKTFCVVLNYHNGLSTCSKSSLLHEYLSRLIRLVKINACNEMVSLLNWISKRLLCQMVSSHKIRNSLFRDFRLCGESKTSNISVNNIFCCWNKRHLYEVIWFSDFFCCSINWEMHTKRNFIMRCRAMPYQNEHFIYSFFGKSCT